NIPWADLQPGVSLYAELGAGPGSDSGRIYQGVPVALDLQVRFWELPQLAAEGQPEFDYRPVSADEAVTASRGQRRYRAAGLRGSAAAERFGRPGTRAGIEAPVGLPRIAAAGAPRSGRIARHGRADLP